MMNTTEEGGANIAEHMIKDDWNRSMRNTTRQGCGGSGHSGLNNSSKKLCLYSVQKSSVLCFEMWMYVLLRNTELVNRLEKR